MDQPDPPSYAEKAAAALDMASLYAGSAQADDYLAVAWGWLVLSGADPSGFPGRRGELISDPPPAGALTAPDINAATEGILDYWRSFHGDGWEPSDEDWVLARRNALAAVGACWQHTPAEVGAGSS